MSLVTPEEPELYCLAEVARFAPLTAAKEKSIADAKEKCKERLEFIISKVRLSRKRHKHNCRDFLISKSYTTGTTYVLLCGWLLDTPTIGQKLKVVLTRVDRDIHSFVAKLIESHTNANASYYYTNLKYYLVILEQKSKTSKEKRRKVKTSM